ncbi:type II secretion system F family protein [Ectobacillus sp. JY-23]|uniref:competence type IV pilus assembly protein ComGB n=1 Tax=Ectobacillus sp. JY-23 TaxID=2933872 RepID=UPI001FF38A26|nr:competence type IV pilus assembly protein ComGB [Ectobacillus sp. JY-23]UOY93995.1 type II secretion system F family protein [Ectobacillus sp. JY-23]
MIFKEKTKWSLHEQAELLRQLGGLLEKGYALLHALEFLQLYMHEKRKQQLEHAIQELKTGSSLYVIFRNLQFHSDLLGYMFYAELHGDVVFALQQGGKILERKQQHIKKIKKSLQYPLMLLLFLLAMVWVFNGVLVPQFSLLYSSMQSSSSLSDYIFRVLHLLPYVCLGCVCLGGLGVVGYFAFIKKVTPRRRMDIWLTIPGIKDFVMSFNSYYFAVQISSLLQGGLSVREAFILMEKQPHHLFFQCEAKVMIKMLAEGETLERMLMQRSYYEPELAYIVSHGQANASLAEELGAYSELVIEKLENRLHRFMMIIQPMLFCCIGIIVALMYLAMMLPMFQMMNSL